MDLTKFDIGAEIISIITKGMYPNPKDALREYIQNGVDAGSKSINIKIRQDSIVVEDFGVGMNHSTLRKAVRVGVSDKIPTKNVGFMGIGIYSSFHLCDKLTIYSKGTDDIPNILEMNFGAMKLILNEQKEKRFANEIKSEDLVDLQSLLEQCMTLTENGEVSSEKFPNRGTRVELTKIEPEFYSALSKFDEVAEYLRSVIPLRFDKKNFEYAELIENTITEICEKHNQKFELIDLSLQINSRLEQLFRPYRNIDFNKSSKPLKPQFFNLKNNEEFYGVSWGCLNSVRKKLDNKNIRGFILKKQGFSIGNRENLIKYFPRANTFFDRYSGEVIIVTPKILPNAARNDIEYSTFRTSFFNALTEIAEKYDEIGHTFQEISKGDEELAILHERLKLQVSSYNENEEDSERLVEKIVGIKKIFEELNGRLERKGFSETSELKAKSLIEQVKAFETTIQVRIKYLTETKKKKKQNDAPTKNEIAKNVSKISVDKTVEIENYESLYDLLIDLEYKIDDDLKPLISYIDEVFIQGIAKTKTDYYSLLNSIKENVQNN